MNTKNKRAKKTIIFNEKNELVLSGENSALSGTQLERELKKVKDEKTQLNKDFKADIGGIFSVRKRVCKLGIHYIAALNKQFGTSLSVDFILNSDVNIFTQYRTPKEKTQCEARAEKLGKNPIECPQYTAWLFIQLLGRYAKANKVSNKKD